MEQITLPATEEEYIESVKSISRSINWAIKYYNDNHLDHRRLKAKLNGKPFRSDYNYIRNNNDKKSGFQKRNKILRESFNNN
jgi:hypothetical protein